MFYVLISGGVFAIGCIASFAPGFASGGLLFVGCFVSWGIFLFCRCRRLFSSSSLVFVFSVAALFVFLYAFSCSFNDCWWLMLRLLSLEL